MLQDHDDYDHQFPQPAAPVENALLNDWRFQAFTMDMFEHDEHTGIGKQYSHIEIDAIQKIKGKKTKNLVLFALYIPTPADLPELEKV